MSEKKTEIFDKQLGRWKKITRLNIFHQINFWPKSIDRFKKFLQKWFLDEN